MKFMTLGDKILILFLVVASIASIFAIPRLLTTPGAGKQVVVNLDGEVIYTFPLEDRKEPALFPFNFTYNQKEYTGILEMQHGKVRLQRLPEEISPLTIHTDMGWISESYQVIVCLPIRLYVTVEAAENEVPPVDAISY